MTRSLIQANKLYLQFKIYIRTGLNRAEQQAYKNTCFAYTLWLIIGMLTKVRFSLIPK